MTRTQQSIQAFGCIAKLHSTPFASRKRKASPATEDISQCSAAASDNNKKRRVKTQPSSSDTPTRAISRRLAGLELTRLSPSPPTNKRIARSTASPTPLEDEQDTPPTSPCPSSDDPSTSGTDCDLPRALEDFRALNAALLGALSLHYAHHGTASPMNITHLAPSVTRIWGKRKVGAADIERCLGVLERWCGGGGVLAATSAKTSPFPLFDYGAGRICIELVDFEGRARMGTHFDRDRSAAAFERGLRRAWAATSAGKDHDDMAYEDGDARALAFVQGLPRASIVLSPTAKKTAQSITQKRGQKRLEEVLGPRDEDGEGGKPGKRRRVETPRALPAAMMLSEQATKPLQIAAPAAPALSRAESLLDRIRAKQLRAASLPSVPSADQLTRAAALHRAAEVMSIIDLLVAARGQGKRASFPRRSLAESVRASLRSPMAREEVERCIDVIAREVAPGYVKVLQLGAVSGVVVDTGMKPKADELRARVAAALV